MVEEMYKEENIVTEMDSNSPSDAAAVKTAIGETEESEDRGEDLLRSTTSKAPERCSAGQLFGSKSDYFPDVEMMEPNISRPFQHLSHAETESECGLGRPGEIQRPAINDCSVVPDTAIIQSIEGSGRYMAAAAAAYHMSELERFENGTGVSLTLGLQHSDGNSVPMSIETHHNYISLRGDGTYSGAATSMGAEAGDFDCMDSGNRHDHFGSSQLLHDFVA